MCEPLPPEVEKPTTDAVTADEPASGPPADGQGPHVPGYEILGELGYGGMGVVYKARQVALNRVVALKMIRSAGAAGSSGAVARLRFRAEAEAIARLRHPNIVQVFDHGAEGEQPFYAMELLEGVSLSKRLRESPPAPAEAAALVEALARAMAAAHQAGVVHRDLKPANVLFA